MIRAGVDDRAMLSATGVNVRLLFVGVFAIGGLLAGLFRRDRRLGAVGRAGRGRALSDGLAGRRHRRRHGLDHRRGDRRAADRARRAARPRLLPDLRRRADLRHHGRDAGAAAAGHHGQRADAPCRSAATARRGDVVPAEFDAGDCGARRSRWCCFRSSPRPSSCSSSAPSR